MASFADAFSAENVQKIMQDPRVQLGLQMLSAGGPMQGNPSFGQRLGMAGQGFAQQQHQNQLQQMRAMQMDQQRQQQNHAAQLQQQMASPEVLRQLSPTARQLAQGGAPADQVWKIHELESQIAARQQQLQGMQSHREGTLAEQQRLNDARIAKMQQAPASSGAQRAPRQPTPRQTLDEPLPNGMIQRHIYDAETGGYQPYGAPFARSGKAGTDPLDGGDPAGQMASQILGRPADMQPSQQVEDVPLPPGVERTPEGMAYRGDVPMPNYDRKPTAPMAAAGGGQASTHSMADYQRDLAQAQQVLQMNPGARAEIDRRLREKYGRGL